MALAKISRPGTANAGGGCKLYYIPVADVTTIAAAVDNVISTDLTLAASKFFYEIEFTEETAKFSPNMVGPTADNKSFKPTVDFVTAKLSAATNAIIASMVGNRFIVLFQDANGTVWIIGSVEKPARLESLESTTGASAEDANGYTYQMVANSTTPADTYTGAIVLS